MSIFELLEIIFFRRTEKSGNKSDVGNCSIINVAFESILSHFFVFFGKSILEGPVFGHS
jgi:hypothetical protein